MYKYKKNIKIYFVNTYSSLLLSFSRIIASGFIELGLSFIDGTKGALELSILSLKVNWGLEIFLAVSNVENWVLGVNC